MAMALSIVVIFGGPRLRSDGQTISVWLARCDHMTVIELLFGKKDSHRLVHFLNKTHFLFNIKTKLFSRIKMIFDPMKISSNGHLYSAFLEYFWSRLKMNCHTYVAADTKPGAYIVNKTQNKCCYFMTIILDRYLRYIHIWVDNIPL